MMQRPASQDAGGILTLTKPRCEGCYSHNAPVLKLTNAAHVEAIRKAVELHKPNVLAIDPLTNSKAATKAASR